MRQIALWPTVAGRTFAGELGSMCYACALAALHTPGIASRISRGIVEFLLAEVVLSKLPHRSVAPAAAFTPMVNEHWHAVYRLAYTLAGTTHDAEDLTQETFLRAMSRFDSFTPGTNMRSWLLRIVSNVFFDERRKQRRTKVEALEQELPGRDEEPGKALEIAQQSALVRAALQELSELTRMVFHLRATEDLSFREVAEIAGTTEQAARWHMHHARTKLLEQMGDKLDEV